ncbi:Myxococcus cysteine-rich repeat-containing protein [Nannocystis exedens]|uniref:Myxococcus cysteine-rich repeat-containing protein n=1 Tax=Nannocystis exedens TaxID=54 RepID=A0A1I2J137_9BACT|nr:hypothetical protein [Nannocystis exedens]PCC69628.1 hypothetical protein NAEX_02652 [Nannocystis exedens]SFF47583.1 Myxococcus cysteine-rich repeat-containing protein [Nannocystis exedens]
MPTARHASPALFHVLTLCVACPPAAGDPNTATDPQATGTDGMSTTQQSPTGTAATATSSSTDDAPLPTTTGPAPTCPDGDLDDGEVCDDGNTIDGDGCNNDCAPSGELLFEHRPPTDGTDEVRSIAVAPDGTIVVGGVAPGLLRWVARFDAQLTPLASHPLLPDSTGHVLGVAVDESAIYAAGGFDGGSDGRDAWVARLSPDGAIEWEDTLSSGFGDEYFTQAALVGDGLVVAGFGRDADALSTLFARRYAPDGAVKWTAGHPLGVDQKVYPLGPGLGVTADAVVTGYSRPEGDQFPEFLAAFSPGDGAPLWAQALPTGNGVVNAIAPNAAGLVLAGPQGFEFLGVQQVGPTGEPLWSSQECTGSNARDVAVDSRGDIVVIGDGDGATSKSIRLCKFSPDGQLRWGKDIDGGNGLDLGYAVAIDAADRIIAGGTMADETIVGDVWLAIFSP